MSKLKAILLCRCPRCRKGRMFIHPPYHPRFNKMHRQCPVCGQHYEVEPGYFYGAMYFSYALNVAEMVALAILVNWFIPDAGPWAYVTVLLLGTIILMPLNFRYARSLMLHLISPIKYDSSYSL